MRLFGGFGSYIDVMVFGSHMDEFVNALMSGEVKTWEIKKADGMLFLKCRPYHYKRLAGLARRHGVRSTIEKRHGFYFRVHRYKKRYGVPLGVMGYAAVIVLLSLFVWDIRVAGNEEITSGQIKEILLEKGVTTGIPINSFDTQLTEIYVRNSLEKLAWVSLERDGSRVYVKILEGNVEENPGLPAGTPCNIISLYDGVIVDYEVYRGQLMYEKGSGVVAGDILVSGLVDDGGGNVLLQQANAKVILECTAEVEFYAGFVTQETRKTGVVTRNSYIELLGASIPFLTNQTPADVARYSEETRKPEVFGFPLPFRVKTCVYEGYEYVEVQRTSEEALKSLNSQIEAYLGNFYAEAEIVSQETEIVPGEDGISARLRLVYRADAAVQREFRFDG